MTTIRRPSLKTLARVFEDPKAARALLKMPSATLRELESSQAFLRTKLCAADHVKNYEIRLHLLNELESGLHGVEYVKSMDGTYASYLNTGDMYAATLIFWGGNYRVQSLGDFIERQERRGIHFP